MLSTIQNDGKPLMRSHTCSPFVLEKRVVVGGKESSRSDEAIYWLSKGRRRWTIVSLRVRVRARLVTDRKD